MRGKRAAFQSALRRHAQHLRLYPESGEEEVVESMLTLMYGPSHGINIKGGKDKPISDVPSSSKGAC